MKEDHFDETSAGCIERVPIFSGLSPGEILEIAAITRDKIFEKGQMVYMAGDMDDTLYVLHSGRVKISRISATGREQVIRVLGPGEFMGELSLFNPLPLTENAEVRERSTMCLIEGTRLKELMNKYPVIALKVLEEVSKRLEQAENLIESINLNTVEQRLAQALLTGADEKGRILLNMTKGDFASRLGMSQETLSRKLAVFQERGLIRLRGHKEIRILDREALDETGQAE